MSKEDVAFGSGSSAPAEPASRELTEQEIFDTVARHLIAQGKASTRKGGKCCYRAPDGSKCAVGILIEDDEYDDAMDGPGFGFDGTDVLDLLTHGLLPEHLCPHVDLLRALQSAHDTELNYSGLQIWQRRMGRIAEQFCLDASALDTAARSDSEDTQQAQPATPSHGDHQ